MGQHFRLALQSVQGVSVRPKSALLSSISWSNLNSSFASIRFVLIIQPL